MSNFIDRITGRAERELKSKADQLQKTIAVMQEKHPVRLADIQQARAFDGVDQGNLFADWKPDYGFSFASVRWNLSVLRSRARDVAKNNPYGRAFCNLAAQNIVHRGFQLNVLASDPGANGALNIDKAACQEIENEFFEWSMTPEYCDAAGRKTLPMICRQAAKNWPRDGEYVIRMMDGGVPGQKNPYGFALKTIRPDYMDHMYNMDLSEGGNPFTGNKIMCGVEMNPFGRAQRYWFRRRIGLQWGDTDYPSGERYSVPAEDIIHGYLEEDEDQPRGLTWFASVLKTLRMDDGYSIAELTTARRQAAVGATYETSVEALDIDYAQMAASGNSIQPVDPGSEQVMPQGWTKKMQQATHPNGNYSNFHAEMIRTVSAGLLVNYNKLGNNLERVNYSSLRGGELSERDVWMCLQDEMVATLMRRVYLRWLRMYLLSGRTHLPMAKFAKFAAHEWHPRRWPWVDPAKDAQYHAIAEDRGWETKTQNAALLGNDLDDVLIRRERERAAVIARKDILAGVGYGGISPEENEIVKEEEIPLEKPQ